MPKLPAFEDWTPPWGDDDEKIDPKKAARLIYNMHKAAEAQDAKLTEVTTERDESKKKVEELEAKDLSEIDKLKRENEKLKSSAPQGEDLDKVRLEIALDNGFTRTQAKRLVGKDRKELEADAEELKKDLGLKAKSQKRGEDDDDESDDDSNDDGDRDAGPPSRRPEPERRRTGMEKDRRTADRTEFDPAKLAATIPRH